MTIFVCENCGHTDEEKEFCWADNIDCRITPGELYTNVQCPLPDCGALAYPATCGKLEKSTREFLDAIIDATKPEVQEVVKIYKDKVDHFATSRSGKVMMREIVTVLKRVIKYF